VLFLAKLFPKCFAQFDTIGIPHCNAKFLSKCCSQLLTIVVAKHVPKRPTQFCSIQQTNVGSYRRAKCYAKRVAQLFA
jgi:hypothetical protein